MTQDDYNEFCGTLPHTTHVVQWGGADVWKVGEQEARSAEGVTGKHKEARSAEGVTGKHKEARNAEGVTGKHKPKNKLFAVGGWQDKDQAYGITFKTGEIAFEMLRDAEGCQPAPYLASRGMKWIMRTDAQTVSDTDMKDYLRESHRLASLNLTKKLQKELGLNQR